MKYTQKPFEFYEPLSQSSRSGFHTYRFTDLVHLRDALENTDLLSSGDYVFRGQRNAQWRLESSLSRRLRNVPLLSKSDIRLRHFETLLEYCFVDGRVTETTVWRARAWMKQRLELRDEPGPDGTGHIPDGVQDVVDVWSVAQHHNAPTPLLDWSQSIFTAAFFAYYNNSERVDAGQCAIFAINRTLVKELSKIQVKLESDGMRGFYFAAASGKYNPRIVAQRGLFTFSRDDIPVERWVTSSAERVEGWRELPLLLKFILPTGHAAASTSLEFLATYSIDLSQMFPDFDGRIRQTVFNLEKDIQHEI